MYGALDTSYCLLTVSSRYGAPDIIRVVTCYIYLLDIGRSLLEIFLLDLDKPFPC